MDFVHEDLQKGSRNFLLPFLCKIPKYEKRVEIIEEVVYNGDKW